MVVDTVLARGSCPPQFVRSSELAPGQAGGTAADAVWLLLLQLPLQRLGTVLRLWVVCTEVVVAAVSEYLLPELVGVAGSVEGEGQPPAQPLTCPGILSPCQTWYT